MKTMDELIAENQALTIAAQSARDHVAELSAELLTLNGVNEQLVEVTAERDTLRVQFDTLAASAKTISADRAEMQGMLEGFVARRPTAAAKIERRIERIKFDAAIDALRAERAKIGEGP